VREDAEGPGFAETLRAVRDVRGWLTDDQARLLYERAAALRSGARVVEIGSYHGRSTIMLAKAAPEAEIIAVDPYPGEDEESWRLHEGTNIGGRDLEHFEANLENAGERERVQHVRDYSAGALRGFVGEIDLLYIDGAHDLSSALGDIQGWGALVREGGTMFVHDSFSSVGVTVAQVVALFFGRRFRYVGRSRSLVEYRRDTLSAPQRLRNAARQSAQLPWFVRNVAVKLAMVGKARPVARLLGHSDDVYPY
jgi:hypothetical protein